MIQIVTQIKILMEILITQKMMIKMVKRKKKVLKIRQEAVYFLGKKKTESMSLALASSFPIDCNRSTVVCSEDPEPRWLLKQGSLLTLVEDTLKCCLVCKYSTSNLLKVFIIIL